MAPREGVPARVALFHGWAESPVWYRTPDDVGPVDLSMLPISSGLRARLTAWNTFADVTLSANDYEFPSPLVQSEFTAAGAALADDLRRELGIDVEYTPDGDDDTSAPSGSSGPEPLPGQDWTASAPLRGETSEPGQRGAPGPPPDA